MNRTHSVSIPFDSKAITIHIDASCGAVYVQFSDAEVARTLDCSRANETVTVDLDKKGMAIGVEAVGLESLTINRIYEAISPHLNGLDRAHLDDAQIALPPVAV